MAEVLDAETMSHLVAEIGAGKQKADSRWANESETASAAWDAIAADAQRIQDAGFGVDMLNEIPPETTVDEAARVASDPDPDLELDPVVAAAFKKAVEREGGGYPIKNEKDLKKAIKAYGRSRPQDRAKTRKHIMAVAKQLGLSKLIPESWKSAK